ncbi:MAG: HEAT repeat domain-containing protein [Chloroflexota bacterium]|jgi:HEAT repeat protein|nr:HEAT repeat domain-containing protein [Chloroflexota bacterium]
MNASYTDEHDFDEIREALLNKDAPFPASLLYFFSDISQRDLKKLEEVWPQVWTERRRGLLEDMETLAEKDTLLFFDHVAVMCLEDEDPVARATAIRLLWQSENEKLAPKLIAMLKEDPQSIVRAAAATALGVFVYLGELEEINVSIYENILKALISVHLGSDERLVRRRALEALGWATHPEVSEFIQHAYETNQEEWLQSALFAMGRSYDKRWAKPVMRMFEHPDADVRYEAVRAAGELELEDARQELFDMLEEGISDNEIYFAVIWSLSKIGGRGVRQVIEVSLEDAEDPEEIRLLEEALENLDFTEQVNSFDMMYIDEEEPDEWLDEDEDDDELLF